jgi:four helix bundle protein
MPVKMSGIKSFKELIAWQRYYKLVLEIYKLTKFFPSHELYGLTQQMRRAAVSVPSNIAEGYYRKHSAEFRQFVSIVYGSLSELNTQYLLSVDLGYTKQNIDFEQLIDEIGQCSIV